MFTPKMGFAICDPEEVASPVALHITQKAIEVTPIRTSEDAERLLDKVRPLIRMHAKTVLKIKGDLDSKSFDFDDHVQELEIHVFQALAHWTPEKGALSTYVTSIVRNKIVDWSRKNTVWANVAGRNLQTEEGASVVEYFPGKDDPTENAARAEWRQALQDQLEQLSPAEQTTLKMFFVDGMSHKNIAETLGESRSTVGKRIERAILRLRRGLKSHQSEQELNEQDLSETK